MQSAPAPCRSAAAPPRTSAPGLGSSPSYICTRTGLTAATSALGGLGSPRPHLHRDRAHSTHSTSAPGLGSPRSHLHQDWAHRWPHLHKGTDRLRQVSLLDAAGSVVSLPWHPTVTERRVDASCCVASSHPVVLHRCILLCCIDASCCVASMHPVVLHRCSRCAMLCRPFVVTSRLSRRRFRNGVFPLRQRAAPRRAYRRQSTLGQRVAGSASGTCAAAALCHGIARSRRSVWHAGTGGSPQQTIAFGPPVCAQVPFARFAARAHIIGKMKRFSISTV